MVTCFIGIGSNLGDRKYNITCAIKKIMMLMSTRVRKVSSLVESAPQGGPPQHDYLNAVIEIETDLSPYQLLQELQNVENSLGRVRTVKNGPRTIDLDILTYADCSINESALCIPHPRILERDFVLQPLRQIAPQIADKLSQKGAWKKVIRKKKKAVRKPKRRARKICVKNKKRAKK